MILYRNDFHAALEREFHDYLAALLDSDAGWGLRRNLLLRMDSICRISPEGDTVFYFAYGSNMNRKQMADRIAEAVYVGIAELPDHRVIFNKRGSDETGKANIVPDSRSAWGKVFELRREDVNSLAKFEPGYFLQEVKVISPGERVEAIVFSAEPDSQEQLRPSLEYLELIFEGAKDLPPDYQDQLRNTALN